MRNKGEEMKVCILSMQRVCNFGSVLQSYSLKSIVKEIGCEVSFIDIQEYPNDPIMKKEYIPDYNKERDGYSENILKRYINKLDKYILIRFLNRIKQVKQENKIRKFQEDVLLLNNQSNECQYDTCIIGSDEVFNCLQGRYSKLTTQLFGNVKQASKVITYAASCGFTKFEYLPTPFIPYIKSALSNLNAISVRDANTEEFVSQFIKEKLIYQSWDPVVIGDFEKEIEKTNYNKHLPDKYCIVYSYANRIHEKREIKEIKRFCKYHGLKIISLGFQQRWIPDFRVVDPFELLYIFKRADFVITDTFHGTIFSAKYSKKFAVIIRQSNENKLTDLIAKIDIGAHVIKNMSDLEIAYKESNDFERISLICSEGRKKTMKYLEENI